ncbi:MAG: SPFH domain-containing protein [Candidatus Electryonea clarkiae]|nr:SPFH domain-containing protein [Candidatus Electryonea clarkiae]MDP8288896.1 SPFH domain-containing protein [Candidatus Electryonea clarkiae]
MPNLGYIVLLVFAVILLISAIKVVREYDRLVIFRLGRLSGVKGPGLIFIIPIIDQVKLVTTRIQVFDVQPQDLLTKDNVSVQVNAVIYFRVLDPDRAVVAAENYFQATIQIAQTTLRAVVGETTLQTLLDELANVNSRLQEIIDEHTDAWGVKVSTVEIKHVDLTPELKRVMAAEAEADREAKAKVRHAKGELEAAKELIEAAEIMEPHPISLTLRYLQTLKEVAAENNSTTLFPIPIDLFEVFLKGNKKQ